MNSIPLHLVVSTGDLIEPVVMVNVAGTLKPCLAFGVGVRSAPKGAVAPTQGGGVQHRIIKHQHQPWDDPFSPPVAVDGVMTELFTVIHKVRQRIVGLTDQQVLAIVQSRVLQSRFCKNLDHEKTQHLGDRTHLGFKHHRRARPRARAFVARPYPLRQPTGIIWNTGCSDPWRPQAADALSDTSQTR